MAPQRGKNEGCYVSTLEVGQNAVCWLLIFFCLLACPRPPGIPSPLGSMEPEAECPAERNKPQRIDSLAILNPHPEGPAGGSQSLPNPQLITLTSAWQRVPAWLSETCKTSPTGINIPVPGTSLPSPAFSSPLAGQDPCSSPSDSLLAREVRVRGMKWSNLVNHFLPLLSRAWQLWCRLCRGCSLSAQGRVLTVPSLRTLPCQPESLVWPGLHSPRGPPWRSLSVILDPQRLLIPLG